MMDAMSNTDIGAVLANAQVEKNTSLKKPFNKEEARKTAEDFEAFFLSQFLESMFAEVKPDSMFGGGHAEKIYRSLMLDEYGKMMAKNGGIGVADKVMESLLKTQEFNNNGDK